MERKVCRSGADSRRSRTVLASKWGSGFCGLLLSLALAAAAAADPALSMTPHGLDFGSQAVGTGARQTIQLTNSGNSVLTIGNVSVTGANAGDFTIVADTGGFGFAPGGLRFVTLQFAPSTLGSMSALLQISSNVLGSPTLFSLTGTGVTQTTGAVGGVTGQVPIGTVGGKGAQIPTTQVGGTIGQLPTGIVGTGGTTLGGSTGGAVTAGGVSLSPGSAGFSAVAVGSVASQTFTITNVGFVPVTISNINVVGDREFSFFVQGGTNFVLQPNESRQITVRFAPTVSGNYNAILIVFGNFGFGSVSARITAAATGVGVPGNVNIGMTTVTPAGSLSFAGISSVDFGSQPVGTRAVQSFTLVNTGPGTLVIQGLQVLGIPGEFSVTLNCPSARLLPGETCGGSVVFQPAGVNVRTATLLIFSNGNGGTLTLSGVGT